MIMIIVLFFCGLTNAWAQSPTPPDARADKHRVLVIGSEQDYPPFATGMTDATAGGFTVGLWKAVAGDTGLRYTITVLPFHQLLQNFKNGKIDVLINLAQSDERRKFVDFTVPHVIVHGAIFVRKGDAGMDPAKIRSESDLAGKSLIVLKADLAHEYALAHGWGKQLVLVETAAEGMRLLASGRHDALLLSKLVGMQTLQAKGLTGIVALKLNLGFIQKFSFAVHKGQSELLSMLNEGLSMTKSDGTYDTLYNRWFGVFEAHEVRLSDVLIYLYPLVAAFFLIGWYFWWRRQIERRQAAAAIAHSRDLLMTIINTVPVRVFWKDLSLRYVGCNTSFAEDAGCRHAGDIIGKNDRQLVWSKQAEHYYREDRAVIASGAAKLFYEEPLTSPDGQMLWLRVSKIPLRDQKNDIIGVLGVYEDITERKQLEEQVIHMAFHDALTKLPNRRMLDDRLTLAIAASKRSGRFGALMFLDLDHFKALNDRHGHHAGDALLVEVANRLKQCVREIDTVARTGGDEFVVLLGDLRDDKAKSTELAANIAEKIRSALSAPYLLAITQDQEQDKKQDARIEHRCTASIGVVLFIYKDSSQESILNRADMAMYLAKQDGGNLVRISDIDAESDLLASDELNTPP